jgi:hypothetical protein
LPARAQPQVELVFNEEADTDEWPDMDQTAVTGSATGE